MKCLPILLFLLAALSGCDRMGIPDPVKVAEQQDAEGKAIGGACRHSGRALEDCYVLNPSALKAAIFAGWRDMNDYMQQNNIETVKPELMSGARLAVRRKEADTAQSKDRGTEESEASSPATTASARRRTTREDSGTH